MAEEALSIELHPLLKLIETLAAILSPPALAGATAPQSNTPTAIAPAERLVKFFTIYLF
jgi:hypothetical protein